MPLPDWLVSVLIQFPIVVVIGFVAWYAYKQVKETHEVYRTREAERNDRTLAEVRRSHEQLVGSKDQEVARLRDELMAEVKKLGQKVDALTRKLG